MASNFELVGEIRNDTGKGASRRLRRADKVPAIMYGAGKPPVNVVFEHHNVVNHLRHEAFFSHILDIKVGNETEKAILRDVQRHPSKPRILHLDFQRVSATEKLHMRIPLHFINEDKAPGVKVGGGLVSHLMTDVEIACLPANLPEYIEVDVSALDVGDVIHLSNLKLPSGVELPALAHGDEEHDHPVVTVYIPRAAVETEAAPAAEAAAEGAEGAAPAAGGEAEKKGGGAE